MFDRKTRIRITPLFILHSRTDCVSLRNKVQRSKMDGTGRSALFSCRTAQVSGLLAVFPQRADRQLTWRCVYVLQDVARALADGCDPRQQDRYGCTALHAMARSGHAEALQALVTAQDEAALIGDSANNTPLHCAGSADVVTVLVNAFTPTILLLRYELGHSPVTTAVLADRGSVVDRMLSYCRGQVQILECRDTCGRTPLYAPVAATVASADAAPATVDPQACAAAETSATAV
jgi:hypothetical protein